MQMLYPFSGTIQQYNEQHAHSHCRRPCPCALCGEKKPLRAHGFYSRTVSEPGSDGRIRMPRYLCLACRRDIAAREHEIPYSNRMQVSVDTVKRDFRMARAWFLAELSGGEASFHTAFSG